MGGCVPNYRSASFPFGQEVPYRQIERPKHLQVKIRISSTGCSPHADFENIFSYALVRNEYSKFQFFSVFGLVSGWDPHKNLNRQTNSRIYEQI